MFDVLGRITELRKARGWSAYRLAKESGIPQSTIATWYQKQLSPPVDKIEIICDTLGISLSEFFHKGDDTLEKYYKELDYMIRILKKEEADAVKMIVEKMISE